MSVKYSKIFKHILALRRIPSEVKQTAEEIDRLVYELYGLTDKEIRIVEEATH